jgi:hypothetical protein
VENIIEAIDLCKTYKLGELDIEVLKDVNLEEAHENGNLFDFKSLLEKYVQSFKGAVKKENKEITGTLQSLEQNEVFKGNLKKLKTINLRVSDQQNNDGDETTNEK